MNHQPVHELPKVIEADSGSIGPCSYCGWRNGTSVGRASHSVLEDAVNDVFT